MPTVSFRQGTVADAPEMVVVHRRSSFLPVMNTPEEDLAQREPRLQPLAGDPDLPRG